MILSSGENHNLKRYMHPMFITALFTVARTWKQPKCSSTEECIKKNEIMSSAATWMELEIVIMHEVSQKKINIE